MFAAYVDGRWQPGIGDPTVLGWATAFGYCVAVGLCLRAARRCPLPSGRPSVFWLGLTALHTVLATNKLLHLDLLVYLTGKELVSAWGEYPYRRPYQAALIGLVVVACLLTAGALLWASRGDLRRRGVAAVGSLFLLALVTVQMISLHQVDAWLWAPVGGFPLSRWLEFGGVCVAITGAAPAGRPDRGT